jgi:hypothetical protein
MSNPASLSWPGEDEGYVLRKPLDPNDLEQALAVAQAELALAGARRNRYGALPGRDPAICAQLNDDITAAQVKCDAARDAFLPDPKDGEAA